MLRVLSTLKQTLFTIVLMRTVPSGRATIFTWWTMLGSTAIGGPIIGWIGEVAGGRWALATGGVAAIVAALLGWRTIRGLTLWKQGNVLLEEIMSGK